MCCTHLSRGIFSGPPSRYIMTSLMGLYIYHDQPDGSILGGPLNVARHKMCGWQPHKNTEQLRAGGGVTSSGQATASS